MLSVWFLLLRRQFHTRLSLRASAGGSTGVLTVRGTPGQLFEIDGGIQIPVQHQTTLLTVKGPVREGQIRIDPPTATTPLAGGLPAIGQDHSRPIPAGFIEQLPLELANPTSPMACARWWFFSMPATFRSSITRTDLVFASLVVT